MKVLITSFISRFPHQGGLWRYVESLSNGLRHKGHIVDLFSISSDHTQYRMLGVNFAISRKKIEQIVKRKFYYYFRTQHKLMETWVKKMEIARSSFALAASQLKLSDYDIIHAQDAITARIFQRITDTPIVTTSHGSLLSEIFDIHQKQGIIAKKYIYELELAGYRASACTIAPSNWMRDFIRDTYQIPVDKLKYIPNGIDPKAIQINLQHKEVYKPTDKKIILCLARLVAEKGHLFLIEALSKLKAERKDWLCWLVGDGPLRTKLMKICEKNGLHHDVHFLGSRNDVPFLLQNADVVVLPSIMENCPYAILEAFAAGKSVIASSVGGIPELIEHEQTGLLFPSGDIPILTENLKRIMADEGLALKLGYHGSQFVIRNHSLESMIMETIRVYREVLDTY